LASDRRDPDQRRLARHVRQEIRDRRTPYGVRGDEDDPAEPALDHPRGQLLAQPQRRLDVDRLHPAPGVGVELGQAGAVERGGGVDQHVARAQPAGDLAHGPLVCQIDPELAGAIEDCHLVPGIAQRAHDRSPDPTCSSRDDRCSLHEKRESIRTCHIAGPSRVMS
jgi:hypothetical protein